ncbi:MAG: hypothetical protein HY855_05285 [Burkholderiales bacterium]|nr:hypothetical protein [Burkholderiales bacterium]
MFSPMPAFPRTALPGPPPATERKTEPPRGCWLESSRELQQGMRVIEHTGFEQIGCEVPLAWQLAGY